MWTQIENSWADKTGRMRSNLPELANPRAGKTVAKVSEGVTVPQTAEAETLLTPEPLRD